MLFISQEAAEKLGHKLVDHRVLVHFVLAEGCSEGVVIIFVVQTGLNLLDEVLNLLLLLHFRGRLGLLLRLPVLVTGPPGAGLCSPLAELLKLALLVHFLVECVQVLVWLDVPPYVVVNVLLVFS